MLSRLTHLFEVQMRRAQCVYKQLYLLFDTIKEVAEGKMVNVVLT